MTDLTERKLKRVKINLLRDDRFAFWRGIMMVGETRVCDKTPTAYTNGRDEIYGRALIEMLNEKMLAFVVLHENLHKIGRHLSLFKKLFDKEPQLTNMACDYYINQLLVDMDPAETTIEFPKDKDGNRIGLYDPKFKGKDIPTIFRLLKEEQDNSGSRPNTGEGFDEHGWGEADEMTEEQKAANDKEIDQALREGAAAHKRAGNKSGDLERHLSEMLNPKINWKEAMAEFVRSVCNGRDKSTWQRPNRRFLAQDLIMPSMISERVGHVVVGADMSASIGQREINAMLTELLALGCEVHPEKIDLLYWDTRVAGHEEYTADNIEIMPTSTKPRGGGGTDPNCVKRYLTDKHIDPECVIMLTDGDIYGEWPVFDCPTLWIITDKRITAPNGVTIHMEIDQ